MTDAARRSPARWIVLAVIAAIVVAAAGVFAVQALRPGESPADAATRYWTLLAQGKAQEALALTDTPAPSNGLLLTDAIYGKADRGIAHVTAGAFTEHGDTASGTVDYTVHGAPRTARLALKRIDHGALRPASWQLTDAPLATIHATVSGQGHATSLSVDGTALPLPDGDGTIAIPALPGSYTLGLGSDTELLASSSTKVRVTTAPVSVTLKLGPSAALAKQAIARAQTTVNGCFASPDLAADCPLAQGVRNLFNLTAEETVTYHLDQAPQLRFDATRLRVVSTGNGQVTATPTDTTWGTFQNHARFALAFDVSLAGAGGTVALTPYQGGVSLVEYVE
ncbi:MAG TPA: hypothetical protein VGC45_16350 [Gryllotalpicola sp.]